MTTPGDPDQQPFGGVEYPPLEQSRPPVDPYAPVDYPNNYPPPPGYPPPGYPPPLYPPPSYPGYSADPYDPYRTGTPAGTNGMAIGALVSSLVGLALCFCFIPSIVGIVLGVISMAQTSRTGQDGHGMALAGVIVGVITLLLGIVFVIFGALNGNYTSTS